MLTYWNSETIVSGPSYGAHCIVEIFFQCFQWRFVNLFKCKARCQGHCSAQTMKSVFLPLPHAFSTSPCISQLWPAQNNIAFAELVINSMYAENITDSYFHNRLARTASRPFVHHEDLRRRNTETLSTSWSLHKVPSQMLLLPPRHWVCGDLGDSRFPVQAQQRRSDHFRDFKRREMLLG